MHNTEYETSATAARALVNHIECIITDEWDPARGGMANTREGKRYDDESSPGERVSRDGGGGEFRKLRK